MSARLPETLQGISISRALLRHCIIFPARLQHLPTAGSEELSTQRWMRVCGCPAEAWGPLGALGIPS